MRYRYIGISVGSRLCLSLELPGNYSIPWKAWYCPKPDLWNLPMPINAWCLKCWCPGPRPPGQMQAVNPSNNICKLTKIIKCSPFLFVKKLIFFKIWNLTLVLPDFINYQPKHWRVYIHLDVLLLYKSDTPKYGIDL